MDFEGDKMIYFLYYIIFVDDLYLNRLYNLKKLYIF